ncbi:hypothetical protein C5167_033174 [Papaver somniferum]|uniref:Uncharacterized protein n=1 Tax=Papaver somniferum TaxID=3469 RepID=A0A4Y7KB46_PAPSO|nr:hypothetical protein C5167_033174 [Papaver somniferum]
MKPSMEIRNLALMKLSMGMRNLSIKNLMHSFVACRIRFSLIPDSIDTNQMLPDLMINLLGVAELVKSGAVGSDEKFDGGGGAGEGVGSGAGDGEGFCFSLNFRECKGRKKDTKKKKKDVILHESTTVNFNSTIQGNNEQWTHVPDLYGLGTTPSKFQPRPNNLPN